MSSETLHTGDHIRQDCSGAGDGPRLSQSEPGKGTLTVIEGATHRGQGKEQSWPLKGLEVTRALPLFLVSVPLSVSLVQTSLI